MEGFDHNYEVAEWIVNLIEGKISEDEQSKLALWISESDQNKRLFEKWTDPAFLEGQVNYWGNENSGERWECLQNEINRIRYSMEFHDKRRINRILRYAAVFIGIMLVGYTALHIGKSGEKQEVEVVAQSSDQIVPLGSVAQLVLGDGQIVNLGNNPDETIREKDGTTVHNRDEMLEYIAPDKVDHEVVYNTLMVPLGGEYKITLSDGTKVWLNAASSLRYPTHFEGRDRRVILTGEGYFEVTHDKERPFRVQVGNASVKVLGTKFNVRSYADDSRDRIILAEGSVLVEGRKNGKKNEVLLRPGYGAIIEKDEGNITTSKVNLEAELGWKDDLFVFDNETLSSIMRKMARWYNVSVKYEDNVDTTLHFTGRVQRFGDIRDVFRLISMTNKVKFKVTNREVQVLPYQDQ